MRVVLSGIQTIVSIVSRNATAIRVCERRTVFADRCWQLLPTAIFALSEQVRLPALFNTIWCWLLNRRVQLLATHGVPLDEAFVRRERAMASRQMLPP